MDNSYEMFGKSVQVLGNMQIHKDGNCYISAHQVILIDEPERERIELDDVDEEDGAGILNELAFRAFVLF